MTNLLALAFAQAFGFAIGQPQTADLRLQVKAAFIDFLMDLEQLGMIDDVNGGSAFSVVLDASDDPSSRVALGYIQANVQVKYLSIFWFFVLNLEDGHNVKLQQVGPNAA